LYLRQVENPIGQPRLRMLAPPNWMALPGTNENTRARERATDIIN